MLLEALCDVAAVILVMVVLPACWVFAWSAIIGETEGE